MGTGNMVVEFFSVATSVNVERNLNWMPTGVLPITTAAAASFSDAWNSPSARMTLARLSRPPGSG